MEQGTYGCAIYFLIIHNSNLTRKTVQLLATKELSSMPDSMDHYTDLSHLLQYPARQIETLPYIDLYNINNLPNSKCAILIYTLNVCTNHQILTLWMD